VIINRILQFIFVTCVIGILYIIFNNGALSAGQIFYRTDFKLEREEALAIADIATARTFQGEINADYPVHFYSFNAKKGDAITTRIYIPRLPNQEQLSPVLALMGEGLPNPGPSQLAGLPFTLPRNYGLIISEADPTNDPLERPKFDEPYTQTGYFEGQSIARDLPQDGTFYLVVFTRKAQSGKYALSVGSNTEVGIKETLFFPVTWLRLKVWYGQAIAVVILLLIIVVVIGVSVAITSQFAPLKIAQPGDTELTGNPTHQRDTV
jgi:hypothetical protein